MQGQDLKGTKGWKDFLLASYKDVCRSLYFLIDKMGEMITISVVNQGLLERTVIDYMQFD